MFNGCMEYNLKIFLSIYVLLLTLILRKESNIFGLMVYCNKRIIYEK